jgi:hypothetical protein
MTEENKNDDVLCDVLCGSELGQESQTGQTEPQSERKRKRDPASSPDQTTCVDTPSPAEELREKRKKSEDHQKPSPSLASIAPPSIITNPQSTLTLQFDISHCECTRPPKTPKITIIKVEGTREVLPPPKYCVTCDSCPCISITEESLISNAGGATNKQKRFEVYRDFALVLGIKWKRKQLPDCVTEAIKKKWPDADGKYTGFQKK